MKIKAISIGGLLLCAGLSLAVRAADDAKPLSGTWSLNNWTFGDSVRLTMSYRNPTTRWEWGSDQPIADLQGLTRDQLRAAHASVTFTMERDAGTLSFEGTMMLGVGHGSLRFVPNPTYAAKLAMLGYEPSAGDDASVMLMLTRDISLAFAGEVKLSGLRNVTLQDLVRLRDHGVELDDIRRLAASGYANQLTADDVVKLRDHGVNPEYVARVQSSGYRNLTVDEIVKLHDHGVD